MNPHLIHRSHSAFQLLGFGLVLVGVECTSLAQNSGATDADELAKKLSNPISSLISVPFQYNVDFGIGPNDGTRHTLNIQPVVPVSVSDDWNLIVRTILPVVYQHDVAIDGGSSQFGLGDTVQSFFLSPKEPGPGGMIWGVGPAFLWPTAGNDSLGTGKWAAGPTGVALFQKGPWTYGALANHLWDYAGDDGRSDVNATFLQPFVSWGGLGKGQTITLNVESTYDWNASQWSIPANVIYSRVSKIGNQMVSYGLGAKVYLDGPTGGPEWGLRAIFTFLFPK